MSSQRSHLYLRNRRGAWAHGQHYRRKVWRIRPIASQASPYNKLGYALPGRRAFSPSPQFRNDPEDGQEQYAKGVPYNRRWPPQWFLVAALEPNGDHDHIPGDPHLHGHEPRTVWKADGRCLTWLKAESYEAERASSKVGNAQQPLRYRRNQVPIPIGLIQASWRFRTMELSEY